MFNILTYSTQVTPFFSGMVRATRSRKVESVQRIDEITAKGSTNIYDALERAFHPAGPRDPISPPGSRRKTRRNFDALVDTIFFLTDGKPTAGTELRPRRILGAIREWNRIRRITIHGIGLGDHDAGFLKDLAEGSGGRFVAK
ncbi:MAG: VWA domain-containing protein [Planctomycetota bacterium]